MDRISPPDDQLIPADGAAPERAVFLAALNLGGAAERAAYLAAACGPDAGLRRRVDALLRAHAAADGFLAEPVAVGTEAYRLPPGLDGCPAGGADGAPGRWVGPYKLLQRLGEGGMGVVYMAEQERPVRRRVALKVIKPGMDSAQVVARFEAERQALALMDHVNIARVLDAGAAGDGRPYFVMELVHGVPITQFCDDHRLPLRERLDLFVAVCQALQHAHQKGVIHRDVKPSNVLVTLYDGKPVPKVIDFGVAKATDQQLTDRTLFTRLGALVGTFEYMAPEQAETSALGVDTRSDVYSLGVLLYELLTGTTPLGRQSLREAALGEVLRRIREEEPPRPSARLSTSGDALADISARRRAEPVKLSRLVSGDLDWIVMKCLEKDRTRRYESAGALARDVEHHLRDEPVAAGPPAAWYRARKFARRNRVLLATAGAVLAALVAGLGAATAGLLHARAERDRAVQASRAEAEQRARADEQRGRAERNEAAARQEAAKAEAVNRFLQDVFALASPEKAAGKVPTVRAVLDAAARKLDRESLVGQPEVEAAIRHALGTAYLALGLYQAAQPQLEAALDLQRTAVGEDHPDVARGLSALGDLAKARRDHWAAMGHYRRALDIRRRAFGEDHPLVAESLDALANTLTRNGDLAAAEGLHEQALAIRRRLAGDRSSGVAASLHNRGLVHLARKDYAAAEALFREALGIYRTLPGDQENRVGIALENLAYALLGRGDRAEAEKLLRHAIDIFRRKRGTEHHTLVRPLNALRHLRGDQDHDAWNSLGMEILRLEVRQMTREMEVLPTDPSLPAARGTHHARLGRFDRALADWDAAIGLDPDEHWTYFRAGLLVLYLGEDGRHRELVRRMFERFKTDPPVGIAERLAKVALLHPDPPIDRTALLALADRAVALDPPPHLRGWVDTTKAFAEYRVGNYPATLRWVGEYRAHRDATTGGTYHHREALALAVEAMAFHRLNRPADARKALDEAARLVGELPKPGEADIWEVENWCASHVALREAEALIRGRAPGVNPGPGEVAPPPRPAALP